MDVTMMKGHTILIAKHKDIVDPLVIIQILSVPVSIEKNNVLHGMYSRSDTNVRNNFVTEKMLKQGAQPNEGIHCQGATITYN